jgi:hypothetical protein
MSVEITGIKETSSKDSSAESQYKGINSGDDDQSAGSAEKEAGGLFSGIIADLNRRIFSPNYILDWTLVDKSHLEDDPNAFVPTQSAAAIKILAATLYIFISQVLPALTFALLLSQGTNEMMGAAEVLLAMAIGGLLFALFAGQPLVVVGVTGPIVILVVGIYQISAGFDFRVTYFWSCFWSMLFHIVIAATNICDGFPKYVTEFSGEIFGFLICTIYLYEGIYEFVKLFNEDGVEEALLAFILGMGTLWLCTMLSGAKSWPILNSFSRELLCDYGPIISVVIFTCCQYIGIFKDIHVHQLVARETFNVSDQPSYYLARTIFDNMSQMDLSKSDGGSVMLGFVMGIIITLLLWFDHNISALISHRKQMKRGLSFNWDFFLLGLAIGICGILGIPPNYGLLPQAPLHVRALATIKNEKLDDGSVREHWEYIAETRYSSFGQAALMLVTLAPPVFALVAVIPTGVLGGMFVFLAVEGWKGNSLFDRGIELLVCEAKEEGDEGGAGASPTAHDATLDDIQLGADGHAHITDADDDSLEAAPQNFTTGHRQLHGHTWKDVPAAIVRNFTIVQLVLVVGIFVLTLTPAVVAFPLFICALIPLRFLIEKWAFGSDADAGAGAGAGDVEGQLGDKEHKEMGCEKTMKPLFQGVFGTANVPGGDREKYLEILDPLVKS